MTVGERAERKLAAIFAADVAGYSRMMSEDEEATLRILNEYRLVIDRLVGEHSGRVFGCAGDSIMAEFASPVEAVRCAIGVQGDLGRLNDRQPEQRRMRFRIGINLGDVIVGNGDLFGDGVNIAARIETTAEPGGICISDLVHESVRRNVSVEFEDLGERTLKNIAEPVRIWSLRSPDVKALREHEFAHEADPHPLARLYLLGDFRLDIESVGHVTLRGRKTRAILAYVALADGGSVSREELAAKLWSRSSGDQARGSLRQGVKELRTAFGDLAKDILFADRNEIRLDMRRMWVDALELELRSHSPLAEDKFQVTEVYRGDLLSGLDLLEDQFREWLIVERSYRRDLALGALEYVLRDALAGHSSERAAAIARSMLRIDQTNEFAHQALMRVYNTLGDHERAFRQYRTCKEILSLEMGTFPSQATDALLDEIANPGRVAPTQMEPADDGEPASGEGRPSIAVLPFMDIGGQESHDYLCEGLADDLITCLSKFREVLVIARASSFVYKDQRVDPLQVARRLRVQYIVEGSLRQVDQKLRLNTQLIDGHTGRHVWADRYDVPVQEMVGLVDGLIDRIVGTILPMVELAQTRLSNAKPQQNIVAYDYYLRGKHLLYNATGHKEARTAYELLERSVSIDPSLTIAYGHLVRLCNTDFVETIAGSQSQYYRDRAFELARKALAQDPLDPHSHISIGWCYLRRRKFDRARFHIDRALVLNPHDADRNTDAATALMYLGEHEKAIRVVKRAMELNPNHPESYLADLAEFYFITRKYEESVAFFEMVSMHPPKRLAWKAAAFAHMGLVQDAKDAANESVDLVRGIWAGPANAGRADYVTWMLSHCPFKHADDSEHLRAGLRLAGLPA